MKALSLQAPLNWKRIETPEPPPPGLDEAMVRVDHVGVCGTDLSGYLGKMPFFSYPRIPGHELGVEVLAVGDGVSHVRPGDHCAVEPYMNCQQCYACKRGFTNCCESNQTLGVHCDGGLRPRFIVPARKLHVSHRMSFEQLALVETLAIGCHAVNRASVQAHESVLIIGAGPIGLSVLEFVKLSGAKVIVLDMNEARLEFCRRVMGVTHTLQPSDRLEQELRDIIGGHKADVVFDATGNAKSMSTAFRLLCHGGGRLVYVGITTDELSFRQPPVHAPEATVLASRNALPGDFTRIISLIEEGKLDTRPWITHRASFEELIDVFPSYTRPETGVIKAVIRVGDEG